MSIFLKWRQSCGGSSCCCRLLRTFDFISSRPTVATVLGCGLLLLSSFCGLSRRCSRCFIIWSPRTTERRRRGGVKHQEKIEGEEKQGGSRRVKGSFPVMSNPPPPLLPQVLLYSYMFGSQQAEGLKGDTAETGAHFTISACSTF